VRSHTTTLPPTGIVELAPEREICIVELAPEREICKDGLNLFIENLDDRRARKPVTSVRTLVAMPAYNEEKYIAKTIVGARKYAERVLVVDDGSKDDTVAIARALGAIVVQHTTNCGYGGALQTIFATARQLGADELVVIDSDGQHNPQEIPRLLTELRKGNDVVIGSRFIDGSNEDIPAYRKVGMKVLDTATSMASDLRITDSQSGFRAYGKRAIESIYISGDGMSAGSEILIQISDHRLEVAEVPIKVRYDIEDTSSENPISHGIGVLMSIVRQISFRRPLMLFGIPGLLFTGFGFGTQVFTFSQYYRTGQFHYVIFTGGFSLLMLGLLLATVGLILYAFVHTVLQGQGDERKQTLDPGRGAGSQVGERAEIAELGTLHHTEGVQE